MNKRVRIHTLIIEKDDGTPLVTLGRITKDPIILAGFLIALKNLSEEISELKAAATETTFTFHNFGKYFVLLLSKENILSSLIIDTLEVKELEKIGNLLKLLNYSFNKFKEMIWDKLNDLQRETNLIPQEFHSSFEDDFVKTIISKDWYEKVAFSEYFMLSDSGISAIKILYKELMSRLITAFGPKLTKQLLERLSQMFEKEGIVGNLKIIREGKKLKAMISIPIENTDEMFKSLEYLVEIYLEIIRRIKILIHKDALEQLNVISFEK